MNQRFLPASFLFMMLIGCILASSAARAQSDFYAGVGAGVSLTRGSTQVMDVATLTRDISISFQPPKPPPDIKTLTLASGSTAFDLRGTSAKGVLFLGYRYTLAPAFLAAEIFGDLSQFDSQTSGFTQSFKINDSLLNSQAFIQGTLQNTTRVHSAPAQYGIDFRPGLWLGNRVALYGRIGVGVGEIKVDSSNVLNATETDPSTIPPSSFNFSVTSNFTVNKTRPALRVGAGLEYLITPVISIRGDYIYSTFGKADNLITKTEVPVPNPVFGGKTVDIDAITNTTKVIMHNHSALVALTYYFH